MSCIGWVWEFAVKNNREYYLLSSDYVLYLCMVWTKRLRRKGYSEESWCEWSYPQNTEVVLLVPVLFVILWEEVENAAGDEKQQEKERGVSKTKKVEKSEQMYEEQLVW